MVIETGNILITEILVKCRFGEVLFFEYPVPLGLRTLGSVLYSKRVNFVLSKMFLS